MRARCAVCGLLRYDCARDARRGVAARLRGYGYVDVMRWIDDVCRIPG